MPYLSIHIQYTLPQCKINCFKKLDPTAHACNNYCEVIFKNISEENNDFPCADFTFLMLTRQKSKSAVEILISG